jgi:hypothetical protein
MYILETLHVLSHIHLEKSTSAMATENKQQRLTIEKSKFAFRHFREKS